MSAGKQSELSKSESETASAHTFLHVLVLLEQVSGCVHVVGETDGGKMLLSAFHLARKLHRSTTKRTLSARVAAIQQQ